MTWQALPLTSANPDALVGAAATLESMAAEAGATGDRVSGILHSGVPDFSSLLGPPIMNRASEHGIMARAVQRLLTYGASVTRAWAADVAECLAQCNQIIADRQRYDPDPMRWTTESPEIAQLNQRTVALRQWFEEQARRRSGQLRDGPTPDRLSELGRGHEFSGLAARIWSSWEPPPLRMDGAEMPALVRRWQDGAATPQEARAAAEWYADYQDWREQLLAGGRYLNAEDLETVRDYEAALAAAGLAGAVVAGRLRVRREGTEFRGWQTERASGYERKPESVPLAEQFRPSVSVEVTETTPLFQHSDERYAQYRSADDHRRDWYVDANVGTTGGITNDGLVAKVDGDVEAGWRRGAIPVEGLPGGLQYRLFTVSAQGEAGLAADDDRFGLHGEAGAEATVAKIGSERLVEEDLGPVTVRAGGEVGVGAGATAKGGAYIEDWKLHLGGKVGAKLGLGLKGNADIEIDLKELADMVTPDDRPGQGRGGGGGSF